MARARTAVKPGRTRFVALGACGVVLGHHVAYVLTSPSPYARASILRATGHLYWHAAVAATLVGGFCGVADYLYRQFAAGRDARAVEATPSRLIAALAVFQLASFSLMEVAERAAAGARLATLLNHDLLVVGLGMQVVVAAILGALLWLFGRVAHAAGVARRRPLVRRPRRLWQPRPSVRAALVAPLTLSSRGPPVLV